MNRVVTLLKAQEFLSASEMVDRFCREQKVVVSVHARNFLAGWMEFARRMHKPHQLVTELNPDNSLRIGVYIADGMEMRCPEWHDCERRRVA